MNSILSNGGYQLRSRLAPSLLSSSIPFTGIANLQAKTIFVKNEARTRGKMDFLAKNEKTGLMSGYERETQIISNSNLNRSWRILTI